MPRLTPEQLATEWTSVLGRFPREVCERVCFLAGENRETLASHFYEQMMLDAAATKLLSHDQVRARLHSSMQRWIVSVFSAGLSEELLPVIALQVQIGEIHARIDVPVHLVLRGARCLKERFIGALHGDADLDSEQRLDAALLISDIIDLAIEIMCYAYSSSHDRNSRAEESYKLFSVVQNVSAERERQRAALLDWENQLMFDLAVGAGASQLTRIGDSELGLWFRHKGAHAFEGASETELILGAMQHIDDVLLPVFDLHDSSERVQRLRDLREQSKMIGFHLDSLFEQSNELESGRDVLTRLLNRKFLPVVLSKEVGYARRNEKSFALLALDIDHFKNINDSYGHETGDMVLQQLAVVLSNSSRGGDYLFRMGGEEFLVLLVDVDAEKALHAAEKLRQQVSEEVFRLPQERSLQITVSIGLAVHNGHPDYQRTLRSADEALYQAKRNGRNCVVTAG